jgi:hypothetical protein
VISDVGAFGADAYRNEMGITNDLFPEEVAFGIPKEQMTLCDRIPDPEDRPDRRTRRRAIDNFEAFMKFLAPAWRGPIDDIARAGEVVSGTVGCAACHVPSLQTGPRADPLFNNRWYRSSQTCSSTMSEPATHPAGGRRTAGAQDAGAVGPPAAPAAAARRNRGDHRGRHWPSRKRGRAGTTPLPGALA